MGRSVLLMMCMLALGAGETLAQQSVAGERVALGRVEQLFVEEGHGVFLEARLAHRPWGRELWGSIRLASPAPDGQRFALVRLPQGSPIRRSDLVEVSLVARDEFAIAPLRPQARIVRVVAPSEPLAALMPGIAPHDQGAVCAPDLAAPRPAETVAEFTVASRDRANR